MDCETSSLVKARLKAVSSIHCSRCTTYLYRIIAVFSCRKLWQFPEDVQETCDRKWAVGCRKYKWRQVRH